MHSPLNKWSKWCPSLQTMPRNTPSSFQAVSLDTRDRTCSSCHVPPPGVQCGIKYCHATTSLPDIPAVSYPSLWQQLLPSILLTRPMTDLCPVCHDKAILISHSSNLSEAGKSQVHNYVTTLDKRGNPRHCINFLFLCLNYTFILHISIFVAHCHSMCGIVPLLMCGNIISTWLEKQHIISSNCVHLL